MKTQARWFSRFYPTGSTAFAGSEAFTATLYGVRKEGFVQTKSCQNREDLVRSVGKRNNQWIFKRALTVHLSISMEWAWYYFQTPRDPHELVNGT